MYEADELKGSLVAVMYVFGVYICPPELIPFDVATPAIAFVDRKVDDICIELIDSVGKNMLWFVDANPTVGKGGSGNIVGAVIFGIAIDVEVNGVGKSIEVVADMVIELVLAIVETCGGKYVGCDSVLGCGESNVVEVTIVLLCIFPSSLAAADA